MNERLNIQFLQYYLSKMSYYEYEFKDLSNRLCKNNIENTDLIEFILLIGEKRGFQKCYNELYRLAEFID